MNGWPSFSPSYPSSAVQFPPAIENNFITGAQGTWYKQKSYTLNGAQRCLIADSRFWLAESEQPPTAGPYPPGVAPQAAFANVTYTGPNQTLLDIYRHGKMPPVIGTNIVDPKKGKIAFNILYADGHVATANTGDEAYHSMRMKFPG